MQPSIIRPSYSLRLTFHLKADFENHGFCPKVEKLTFNYSIFLTFKYQFSSHSKPPPPNHQNNVFLKSKLFLEESEGLFPLHYRMSFLEGRCGLQRSPELHAHAGTEHSGSHTSGRWVMECPKDYRLRKSSCQGKGEASGCLTHAFTPPSSPKLPEFLSTGCFEMGCYTSISHVSAHLNHFL